MRCLSSVVLHATFVAAAAGLGMVGWIDRRVEALERSNQKMDMNKRVDIARSNARAVELGNVAGWLCAAAGGAVVLLMPILLQRGGDISGPQLIGALALLIVSCVVGACVKLLAIPVASCVAASNEITRLADETKGSTDKVIKNEVARLKRENDASIEKLPLRGNFWLGVQLALLLAGMLWSLWLVSGATT